MSRQKPEGWISCVSGNTLKHPGCASCVPIYRESPTAREERAVVRAAVRYVERLDENTNDDSQFEALVVTVQKLLAKRKTKR